MFVLAGIALLVAGILAFGARSAFKKKGMFETYIDDEVQVSRLGRRGASGRPRRQGHQDQFFMDEYPETNSNYVVVRFQIRDDVRPCPGEAREQMLQNESRGASALVSSPGITGNCILSLEYVNPANYPPLEAPWTPEHTYIPSAPSQFNQLLASMKSRPAARASRFSETEQIARARATEPRSGSRQR